jgi:hypothetical protein
MEALSELAKTLGYPGAEKLWRAAERQGLAVTRSQVAAFVSAQGQRQVLAPRPKYDGKLVATRINDRWAADLIDYTAKPSEGKNSTEPYQYVLIVQDVFSRKLWAVAMRVKDTQTVREAFEHIVRSGAGVPRELDTDNGLEFRGVFERRTHRAQHRGLSQQKRARNAGRRHQNIQTAARAHPNSRKPARLGGDGAPGGGGLQRHRAFQPDRSRPGRRGGR